MQIHRACANRTSRRAATLPHVRTRANNGPSTKDRRPHLAHDVVIRPCRLVRSCARHGQAPDHPARPATPLRPVTAKSSVMVADVSRSVATFVNVSGSSLKQCRRHQASVQAFLAPAMGIWPLSGPLPVTSNLDPSVLHCPSFDVFVLSFGFIRRAGGSRALPAPCACAMFAFSAALSLCFPRGQRVAFARHEV